MKSIRKHKVGVIGLGYIGTVHIEMLQRLSYVEIVAIADANKELADSIGQRFHVGRIYYNSQALVEDPNVEVIHNCTPNHLHFELNRHAILKGKDILSEKPLALNSDESGILADLTDKNGTITAVNFCYRYYPVVQEASARVSKGELGEIRALMGHFLQDWLFYETDYSWRLDPIQAGKANVIADLGSHWCDLVHFTTGMKIVEVMAELHTCIPKRKKPVKTNQTFGTSDEKSEFENVNILLDEYASVFVKLENGARGSFTTCQVAAGHKVDLELRLFGSKETIAWSHESPNKIWLGHRDKANETFYESSYLQTGGTGKYAALPTGHPMGYHDAVFNLFRDFYEEVDAKRNKKAVNNKLPNFREAHRVMKVLDAAIQSNSNGKWVKVK